MTHAQIDALLLTDEGMVDYLTEIIISEKNDPDYEPSSSELDARLIIYQTKLHDIETERLRIVDLKDRFENLSDMRMAFHNLHPDIKNPAVFLRDELLGNTNKSVAEQLMKDLEIKDVEMTAVRAIDQTKENIIKSALTRLKALNLNTVDPAIKDILIVLRSMRR